MTALAREPESDDWLTGAPMNPLGASREPLPTLQGFPLATPGAGIVIVGPTGGGRSSLIQACLFDAALAGLSCAYLGHEITEEEFNARSAKLVELRGHAISQQLLAALAKVRYFDLADTITRAWDNPEEWVAVVSDRFQVLALDPLSAVESTLSLNFEQSSRDYALFYDRLVQPLTNKGVAVPAADNVGYSIDAKSRARGASAKHDKADLAFACSLISAPAGLLIRCTKARSARSPIRRGDEWLFHRDTQLIERRDSTKATGNTFRPTTLMARVCEALEENGPLSKTALRRHVKGKNEYVDHAILRLEAEEYITREQSGYVLQRPFSEDEPAPADAPGNLPHLPCLPQAAPDPAPTLPEDPALPAYHKGRGQGLEQLPGESFEDWDARAEAYNDEIARVAAGADLIARPSEAPTP